MVVNRRVVRGVGLALVVLPEPFTTPLGVALILIANLIKTTARLYPRRWTVREPFSHNGARVESWQRPSRLERLHLHLTQLGVRYTAPSSRAWSRPVSKAGTAVYRPRRQHPLGSRTLPV